MSSNGNLFRKALAMVVAVAMVLSGFAPLGSGVISFAEGTVKVAGVFIEGNPTEGNTLTAVVTGEGGQEPTDVTYQWQYIVSEYDDQEEEWTDVANNIENATEKRLELTTSLVGKLAEKDIVVEVRGVAGSKATSEKVKVKELSNPDREYLKKIEVGVGFTPLKPIFGTDTQILPLMRSFLEREFGTDAEFSGVTLKLIASDFPEVIGTEGEIHYFFKPVDKIKARGIYRPNPNDTEFRGNAYQPELTFEVQKGSETRTFKKKANVYWDVDRLKQDLKEKVLDTITEDEIKGENTGFSDITKAFELPARLEGRKYAEVLWTTSNPNVLKVEKKTAGLDTKYVFTPQSGSSDADVKLIATIDKYNFTNSSTNEETEIKTLSREFDLVVKGGTQQQSESEMLQEKLNANLTHDKFKDFATKAPVDASGVTADFKLPVPSNLDIPKSYNYKISAESLDEPYLFVNGYRLGVIRPLHGSAGKEVRLKVTVVKKDNSNIRAEKTLTFTLKPLGENDLSDARAFMDKVKAAYFEGIKGDNTDKDNITKNLHSFREAYPSADGIGWSYRYADDKDIGVKPEDLPDYDPMVSKWRAFRSSRPDIISHENLLLTQPEYDTEVIIDSSLSSYPYRNYLKAYPDNEEIKALLNQPVSATLTVKGKKGANPNPGGQGAGEATVKIKFYDGENKKILLPYGEFKVKSGLAKEWGYSSADVVKNASAGNVTMLDALVYYTAKQFGLDNPSEEGAKKKIRDSLDVSSGFVKTVVGKETQAHPFSFYLNDTMPNDGVLNPTYGTYTGYMIDDSVVRDGDILTYLFYQNSDYSDYFTWFEKDGNKVTELTLPQDESVKLTLKGYGSHFAFSTEEVIKKNTSVLANVDICLLDTATGTITKIDGKSTNGKGEVTVGFAAHGEHIVSAVGNNETGLIAPSLHINVVPGLGEEERLRIVEADIAALSFGNIKGTNTSADSVLTNLDFISVGESGKTSITWESSDGNVVDGNGLVKRPLNEEGDKEVTLTATVSYGSVSRKKDIVVTVVKLPGSEEELEKIVGKLNKYITPDEYDNKNIHKKDTNIIELVRKQVKAINSAADVENICEPSAEQTQIAADGTITYGDKAVRNKDVKFVIILGNAKKDFVASVSVLQKKPTKDEALKGDWLVFDMFKGGNSSIDAITKDLELPSEERKYYTALEWKSDNAAVSISSYAANKVYKASVIRPKAGQPDTEVHLTCTIKPGSMWQWMGPAGEMPDPAYGTKVFTLKIKAPSADEEAEALELLKEAIVLFDLNEMTVRGTKEKVDLSNITYHLNNHPLNWNYVKKKPGYKVVFKDIQIEWKSQNPGIVKLFNAVDIKRTDKDQEGDVVLILSHNGASLEKRWHTVVKAFGPNEIAELNKQTKSFADKLKFDLIKEKNTSAINVLSDLKFVRSWKIVDGKDIFGIRKEYHEDGVNIEWTSSHPEVLEIKYNKIAFKKQPEKNTKVTLTAVLSSIKFDDAAGVETYTKEIRVIVPGTNDVPPTEDMLGEDPATPSAIEEAKTLAKSIAESYRAKDEEWWKKNGSFWHAAGLSAYSRDIENGALGLSDKIVKAFVDEHIKKKLETVTGETSKASTDANALANTINALSAFGYNPSDITDSTGKKANAVLLLDAIKVEDAKKGWFSTIAPYVLKAFGQVGFAPSEEAEYIAYLVEELEKEKSYQWGVDTPAMMVQGLAPYYASNSKVKIAVDAALEKISAKQLPSGSFGNSNSDAMVIVALADLGINPHTDARFVKSGKSVVDGLLTYKLADGSGFGFRDGNKINAMSTYQGLLALISAIKLDEKAAAYDVFEFSALPKKPAVYGNGVSPNPSPLGEVTVTILGEQVRIADKVKVNLTDDASELDLKRKGYVEVNAGHFTPLHAVISAIEKDGRFAFTCEKGRLIPKTALQGNYGENAGWIYHVNDKYAVDPSMMKLKNADKVLFFFNKGYDGMMYAAFEKDRHRIKVGEEVTIKVTAQPVKETAENPKALEGARVLRNGTFEGLTDASGSLVLKNLSKGTHVLTLEKENAKGENILIFSPCIVTVEEQSGGTGGSGGSSESVSVKFRLIGAVKNNGKYTKYVTWIATKNVTLDMSAPTVYDVFTKALDEAGLSYVGADNNYVEKIKAPSNYGGYWLGEFDNGTNSGWMYTVNGVHPQVGLKDMEVRSGDSIVWHYVFDYKNEESKNNWMNVADENPSPNVIINMDETGDNTGAESPQAGSSTGAVKATAVVNKDGVAELKLNPEKFHAQLELLKKEAKKIGESEKGRPFREFKIAVDSAPDIKAIEVALPKSVIKELERVVDRISIETKKGVISLDSGSLMNSIRDLKHSEVSVKLTEKSVKNLPITQKQASKIQNKPVYVLEMKSGEHRIQNITGEIILPYENLEDEIPEAVVAYEVLADGTLKVVKQSMVSDKGGFKIRGRLPETFAIGYNKVEFVDIDQTHNDILFLAARGIVNGKGKGVADLNGIISRAEFVQLLANLADVNIRTYENTDFKDVAKGSWYHAAIAWANENGIAGGTGNGMFSPNSKISRQDMIVMMDRFMNQGMSVGLADREGDDGNKSDTKHNASRRSGDIAEINEFMDMNSISNYAKKSVRRLRENGLIEGVADDEGKVNFEPNHNVTRAESMRLLMKFMKMDKN